MAGNGPAPKANRRRTNADTYADIKTTVDGTKTVVRGPTLKSAVGRLIDSWPDEVADLVTAWYETWRRSPLAEAWLATDWQRLALLAPLVADYYLRPTALKMGEIRQSESLLGATHVDRLKARIKVERGEAPAAKASPGVTALDDYRSRLSG